MSVEGDKERRSDSSSRTVAPSKTPDVDLGVIYTHERQYMPRLLETMAVSGDGLSMRLILVDNRSDSIEPWLRYFPQTMVLRNKTRLAYGPNLNRIVEASTAPFVLLLNTDMYFEPSEQCVARMVAFMREHPDCGVAGCRIYRADGGYAHPARRHPSVSVILGRRFGMGRWLRRNIDEYLYRERRSTESFDCEWLSGCFMLVRREALADVGHFDTQFVKYFEDVDFCLRMNQAGWRVMFHGGTSCYHVEQGASRRFLSRDAMRHGMSYLRWLRKWGIAPRYAAQQTAQLSRAA